LGMRHRMLPIAFSPTDPCCHGYEIWDKIGYNSSCAIDFCEIFALVGVFLGMCHRMLPMAFSPTDARCYGNEIWDKIGYKNWLKLGLRKRFRQDFCAYRGVYRYGPLNSANLIFPPTDVAMATKFGTKLAITRLV